MLGGTIACGLPAVGVIGAGGTGAAELDQGPLKAFSDSWVVCPLLWIAEAQTADSTKPAATQDAIFNLISVNVLVIKLLSECEGSVFASALQISAGCFNATSVVKTSRERPFRDRFPPE
jgi:hypothetical protein